MKYLNLDILDESNNYHLNDTESRLRFSSNTVLEYNVREIMEWYLDKWSDDYYEKKWFNSYWDYRCDNKFDINLVSFFT